MTTPSSHLKKAALRQELIACRAMLSDEERAVNSKKICKIFLSSNLYREYLVIAGYIAMSNEVCVTPLLAELAGRDKKIALPVVRAGGEPLEFHAWRPGDPLRKASFGTQEPEPGDLVHPTLIIVPLVGFSRQGNRLGFGGGFYDRTLKTLRRRGSVLAVGVAFECQERHDLPREAHDEQLDVIVTDRDIIKCRAV